MIAIAGVIINELVGRNGVINKVAEVETEYSKEDLLEKINHKVTAKFIEINNEAKATNKLISEMYNSSVVIDYLKQEGIISETYDDQGNVQDGIFDINVDSLKDENQNVRYTGTFRLERIGDKYMVVYYDENNKAKEVGELQIQQT